MGIIITPPIAGAMSGARPKSRRGRAASAFWQWHFALLLLLFPGITAAIPAAAQTSEGGAPSSSGAGPEAGPAGIGGGAGENLNAESSVGNAVECSGDDHIAARQPGRVEDRIVLQVLWSAIRSTG